MTSLPITPRIKHYRGAKPHLAAKMNERNGLAHRVAEHMNRIIAGDPAEVQQLLFATIANDLGVSKEEVRSSVNEGGSNGVTLRVTPEQRALLAALPKR